MSWNVTCTGTKKAVLKEIDTCFDRYSQDPIGEYTAARTALKALVGSVPDETPMLTVKAYGSATPNGHFNAMIQIDAHIPNVKE